MPAFLVRPFLRNALLALAALALLPVLGSCADEEDKGTAAPQAAPPKTRTQMRQELESARRKLGQLAAQSWTRESTLRARLDAFANEYGDVLRDTMAPATTAEQRQQNMKLLANSLELHEERGAQLAIIEQAAAEAQRTETLFAAISERIEGTIGKFSGGAPVRTRYRDGLEPRASSGIRQLHRGLESWYREPDGGGFELALGVLKRLNDQADAFLQQVSTWDQPLRTARKALAQARRPSPEWPLLERAGTPATWSPVEEARAQAELTLSALAERLDALGRAHLRTRPETPEAEASATALQAWQRDFEARPQGWRQLVTEVAEAKGLPKPATAVRE